MRQERTKRGLLLRIGVAVGLLLAMAAAGCSVVLGGATSDAAGSLAEMVVPVVEGPTPIGG